MTFSTLRTATGSVNRRALRLGVALPVSESISFDTPAVGSPRTVVKPSGTNDGDLLILQLDRYMIGAHIPFTQATGGWEELWNQRIDPGVVDSGHAAFWRVVQSGDTTWDFTQTSGDIGGYICSRISGADPADPIADWSHVWRSGGASGLVIPALTSDITNCLLMHLPATGFLGVNTGPGGGEVIDHADSQHEGGGGGFSHSHAHEDFPSGGGTGTRTWVQGSTGTLNHSGGLILINPVEV